MTQKKEFLNYIHLFRGLAIVVIVGIHCRISFPWMESQEFGRQLFTTLLDNGTVLFVFIAGFLFQYLKRKYTFSSYFIRKLKFVILPYIIVSVPILLYKYFFHREGYAWLPDSLKDQPFYINSLYMLLTGKHIGPFWFIPMVFIFYLISPILIKIDKPEFYKFVFPLLFIAGLFTYRFGYYSSTIDSFIHYLPVYIFGMFGSAYRKELTQLKMQWVWVLFISYLTIVILELNQIIEVPKLTSFESAQSMPYFQFNFAKLKVSILCIILIRVFYKFNDYEVPSLKKLADDSFGIFFLHMYIITAIEMIIHKYYNRFELGLITFMLYTVIVTVFSILLIDVLKRVIGKNSRMIIGS